MCEYTWIRNRCGHEHKKLVLQCVIVESMESKPGYCSAKVTCGLHQVGGDCDECLKEQRRPRMASTDSSPGRTRIERQISGLPVTKRESKEAIADPDGEDGTEATE